MGQLGSSNYSKSLCPSLVENVVTPRYTGRANNLRKYNRQSHFGRIAWLDDSDLCSCRRKDHPTSTVGMIYRP